MSFCKSRSHGPNCRIWSFCSSSNFRLSKHATKAHLLRPRQIQTGGVRAERKELQMKRTMMQDINLPIAHTHPDVRESLQSASRIESCGPWRAADKGITTPPPQPKKDDHRCVRHMVDVLVSPCILDSCIAEDSSALAQGTSSSQPQRWHASM